MTEPPTTSTATDVVPSIGCDQCSGRLVYRVEHTNNRDQRDNFVQLVDHLPRLFTHHQYLQHIAAYTDATVKVIRLTDPDADPAIGKVVAYAGPDPAKPGERTWMTDLYGNGVFKDKVERAEAVTR